MSVSVHEYRQLLRQHSMDSLLDLFSQLKEDTKQVI